MWLKMTCFVNFISGGGNNLNFQSEMLESSFQHLSESTSLDTWTVHSVDNLNFDILEDDDNLINWDTGYLRYFGKHHSLTRCMLFLLVTVSFNETLSAMHRSGYGRSSNSLFFIHVDNHEDIKNRTGLLLEFKDFQGSAISSGQNLTSADLTFHTGIVFININSEDGFI